jgi:predicted PurR-regulated permease PerM
MVALVDAVFIGLGMLILGVPLWLPLSLVIFIFAFIPIVGATMAGIIAALVTLVTNGLVPAIVVAIIVVVVNQLEGNLLQPVVLGKSLKLHELVVLIALTTGTVLGGIMGTLISVPLTAVGWALVKAWNESLPELEAQREDDTIRARLRDRWRREE